MARVGRKDLVEVEFARLYEKTSAAWVWLDCSPGPVWSLFAQEMGDDTKPAGGDPLNDSFASRLAMRG